MTRAFHSSSFNVPAKVSSLNPASLTELTGNLESDFQPGLFFAGEVADVDGTCGGYNLQWAFSSGTVAGRAIVKRNQELFKDDRHTMEENDGISERNRRR